jgi:hypothetical protein
MHFSICLFLGTITQKDAAAQGQKKDEMMHGEANRSFSVPRSLPNTSSIWLLLLSVAMMLTAMGDTGFAFSTAYGPDSVLRDVWIWNVIYNADHLCLAAALIGYGSFFLLRKRYGKSNSESIEAG